MVVSFLTLCLKFRRVVDHARTPGAPLTCTAQVTNTGNVGLSNITFGGHADCTTSEAVLLLPQQQTSCNFSRNSTQDDFEAGSISWSASVSATPRGTNSTQLTASTAGSRLLPQLPKLDIDMVRVVSSDDHNTTSTPVAEANTTVVLLVTATNKGNVHLRNVTLEVPGLTTTLSCPVMELSMLEVDQDMDCMGSFLFNQSTFEEGNRHFTAVGSSSMLNGSVYSEAVAVQIAASPGLQVDVDGLQCSKPSRMCE